MLNSLRLDVSQQLSRIRPLPEEEQAEMMRQMTEQQAALQGSMQTESPPDPLAGPLADRREGFDEADTSTWGNPGRNDACPCGSGKKFKHCHGRLA